MVDFRCEQCNKNFDSIESLEQHNKAKHTIQEKSKKSISKNKITVAIILLLVVAGIGYSLANKPSYTPLTASLHVKGNGSIDVVEFADFQCPACGAAFPEVEKILSQYGDKIKFTFKQFPLTSIHPLAFQAAEASECAADQGKFWEYHDTLFANQKNLQLGDLKKYAEQIGLDIQRFNSCIDSHSMKSRVSNDQVEGNSKGVGATPTFFIFGQKYEGVLTFDRFVKEIAAPDA